MLVDTVIANLIIVGGSEGTCVRSPIPLQLPVHSDLSIAIWRVEVTRARFLVDKADDVAVGGAIEEL